MTDAGPLALIGNDEDADDAELLPVSPSYLLVLPIHVQMSPFRLSVLLMYSEFPYVLYY
jgi:hypothetical protein